ncbi:helix-turn-helix domain-containing protein [Aquirufa novilacunae]|uniref:AraC family transcriptional regulator n=1 Tax=Aquirufa novilacunae TaxID=3139305 RepID=A0ABW8U347_9BACT
MIPAICLIGFLSSLLLLNYADKVNPANRYLAYHFFLNALFGIAHWASVVSDSDTLRAIFTVHYFPIYLLNTPFLYFYVRAVLTDRIHINGWDYIHFLPSVLILFNIVPYSLLSWPEKLQFAVRLHFDSGLIHQVYFPFVSFNFYFFFRSVLSLAYIIYAAKILQAAIQKGQLKQAKELEKWLWVNLGLGALFNLSLIIFSIRSFYLHDFLLILDEEGKGRVLATVIMAALMVSVYFFPKILYGLQFQSGGSISDLIELNEKISQAAKSQEFSRERLNQVGDKLHQYLHKKKFLVPGFSLSDLVKDLETPEHVLTYYFNNHKGITFLKWKNQLRIEEAILLLKAGEAETNTLESVGKACGYKSRSNFIQAFKAQTGESPSAYLKKLS